MDHVKSLEWTVLESHYVFQDEWITVRADKCQMPGGRIVAPYYVFEKPSDWVHVVALTESQQVVLIRQYRHGIRRVVLEIPGGVVEPNGELPLQAARRELLEETGYGGGDWQSVGQVAPNPANQTNLAHSFLATGVRLMSNSRLDATEQIETILMPVDEVIRRAKSGEFLQTLHVSGLFFALDRLGKIRVQ